MMNSMESIITMSKKCLESNMLLGIDRSVVEERFSLTVTTVPRGGSCDAVLNQTFHGVYCNPKHNPLRSTEDNDISRQYKSSTLLLLLEVVCNYIIIISSSISNMIV